MGIIWDLFGVHIIVISIILTLLLLWLVWPRRYKVTRKWLLRLSGITTIVGILLAVITYWPKSYEKHYLNNTPTYYDDDLSLRDLADSANFWVGMAVRNDSLSRYYIPQEFNSITAENHFKPNQLLKDAKQWKYDFSIADSIAHIATANNLRLRGHTLVWGKFPGNTYPIYWRTAIDASEDKSGTAKALIKRHITSVVGRYKDQITSWDVVNEPLGGDGLYASIFTEALGEDYIDYSFHVAHEVDPDCALYLNEAIIDYDGPQGRALLALLQRLLDRGVPIHGVGLQTHHIFKMHDAKKLQSYIRAIGDLGLKVEITELDMSITHVANTDDPYAAQGEQFYQIVNACVNEPACQGVTFWGLSDGSNWMDNIPPFKWKAPHAPFLLDEDMIKKPAYFGAWKALKEMRKRK